MQWFGRQPLSRLVKWASQGHLHLLVAFRQVDWQHNLRPTGPRRHDLYYRLYAGHRPHQVLRKAERAEARASLDDPLSGTSGLMGFLNLSRVRAESDWIWAPAGRDGAQRICSSPAPWEEEVREAIDFNRNCTPPTPARVLAAGPLVGALLAFAPGDQKPAAALSTANLKDRPGTSRVLDGPSWTVVVLFHAGQTSIETVYATLAERLGRDFGQAVRAVGAICWWVQWSDYFEGEYVLNDWFEALDPRAIEREYVSHRTFLSEEWRRHCQPPRRPTGDAARDHRLSLYLSRPTRRLMGRQMARVDRVWAWLERWRRHLWCRDRLEGDVLVLENGARYRIGEPIPPWPMPNSSDGPAPEGPTDPSTRADAAAQRP